MPTENRSSTIEQHDHIEGIIDMVSVPREVIEFAAGLKWHGYKSGTDQKDDQLQALNKLRAILAKPAPQPHPDPIAWMVGTAIWWTKEEAERDAAATGLPIVGLGPMTGAAEVERLRGENEQLREVIKHSDSNIQRQSLRISNQRAQLAEQDALLRELADAPPAAMEFRLQQKVRAALSASTEPSVREAQALQAEKSLGIERLPLEPSTPDHESIRAGMLSDGLSELVYHALRPNGCAACSHMLDVRYDGLAKDKPVHMRCKSRACKRLFELADSAALERKPS